MTDRLRTCICLILAFVLTANPLLASAGGMAEDPAAPKGRKPGLTAAPNGVPLVNIARPDIRYDVNRQPGDYQPAQVQISVDIKA